MSMTASGSTLPLAQATDASHVGGKAWNLSRLLALDVNVPPGVVLPAELFERLLDTDGLRDRIDRELRNTEAGPDAARDGAARVREMVMAARLPVDVRSALEDAGRDWAPGTSLAVRSSAAGEDGAQASFAGQLDTVLEVDATNPGAVEHAVRTCWASYWSERVVAYRRFRRVAPAGMAVILQQQVASAFSGVLFTREPGSIDGDRAGDGLLVEYCEGLGEALVSGRVDPARIRIGRQDFSTDELAMLDDEDARGRARALLTPALLAGLAHEALRLERELGGPQDIEWTVDSDGRLWWLQSRPITTAPSATVSWSNANVSENFPEPISPLLYSIASAGYYHYFRNLGLAFGVSRARLAAMDQRLRALIGVHSGRMYYNLTNLHAVLRMAPFGDRLAHAFNTFVGADALADTPADAIVWSSRGPGPVRRAIELAGIAVSTAWQFAWLGHRVSAFERQADAFARRTHPDLLASRDQDALTGNLAEFMEIRCRRWKNASLADAAAMVSYAMLERSLDAAGADPAVHNRLLRALPGVPSSQPALRLWALSRDIRSSPERAALFADGSPRDVLDALRREPRHQPFARRLDAYLEDWGFRSSSELMLTVPSLGERPEPVIELLRQYARGDGEAPTDAMARQAAERVTETSRLLRRLTWRSPLRAVGVWRWLTWTQRAVAYRERARLKQALLYTRCRRIALELGDRLTARRLLAAADDVFFLTWPELRDLATGRAMFPSGTTDLVLARRADHARFLTEDPPDTLRLAEGAYWSAVSTPGHDGPSDATSHADEKIDAESANTPGTFRGASACGGTVTAPAAVLSDVSEAHRLTRGDVLVTRQTDPGWCPVLCLVSGLVIERGGMLSHGAIIAREFGLPCVVGVRDASSRIPHGAMLRVDGDAGTCDVVEAPAASAAHADTEAAP